MLEIRLKPRTAADGSLILELGLAFRVVFGVLAAILAVGVGSTGTIGIVPAGILVVMVVGAMYQEKWTFDPTERRVIAQHGLLPWSRRRTWTFDEITEVQFAQHRLGIEPEGRMSRSLQRHFLKYWLVLQNGSRVRIEMRKVTDWNSDFALPKTVATTLALPITDISTDMSDE